MRGEDNLFERGRRAGLNKGSFFTTYKNGWGGGEEGISLGGKRDSNLSFLGGPRKKIVKGRGELRMAPTRGEQTLSHILGRFRGGRIISKIREEGREDYFVYD